jgi:hypothetical protein
MPCGTSHVESGLLGRDLLWWTLNIDGGGTWRLDGPAALDRYVGRRVELTGTRIGYDLLVVQSLRASDGGAILVDFAPWFVKLARRVRNQAYVLSCAPL